MANSDDSSRRNPMMEIECRGHLQYPFVKCDVCFEVITDVGESDVVWVTDTTPIIPRMIHTNH